MKIAITENMTNPDIQLFDEAQLEILRLIEKGPFTRFMRRGR